MGRLLAIDFGEKRVGLALSDPMHIIAKPYKTISYSNYQNLLIKIKNIILNEEIEKIVLGLPLNMKGDKSNQTNLVLEFSEFIKNNLDIPVDMQDERLSTVSAKKSLIAQKVKTGHNKDRIDETAAAIFLQHYLDQN